MKPFALEQELDLPHLTEIVRKALDKPSLRDARIAKLSELMHDHPAALPSKFQGHP